MKEDICSKLRRELDEPISSERQVVYILVELRKLIELNGDDERFRALNFFCDWAVHAVLDQEGAKRIVRRFNNLQMRDYEAKWCGKERIVDIEFDTEMDDTIHLCKFRTELATCLQEARLDDSIANDRAKWRAFIIHYAQVIEACPLRCLEHGMEYTDEVIITFMDLRDINPDEYAIAVRWSWVNKKTGGEGRTYGFF
jgi:hypothetical protein